MNRSNTTLYWIDYDQAAALDLSTDFDGMPDPIRSLIEDAVLIPSEKCEHGNVYPHHISYMQAEEGSQWWNGKTCAGIDSR